jgi:hypothetical protein
MPFLGEVKPGDVIKCHPQPNIALVVAVRKYDDESRIEFVYIAQGTVHTGDASAKSPVAVMGTGRWGS